MDEMSDFLVSELKKSELEKKYLKHARWLKFTSYFVCVLFGAISSYQLSHAYYGQAAFFGYLFLINLVIYGTPRFP